MYFSQHISCSINWHYPSKCVFFQQGDFVVNYGSKLRWWPCWTQGGRVEDGYGRNPAANSLDDCCDCCIVESIFEYSFFQTTHSKTWFTSSPLCLSLNDISKKPVCAAMCFVCEIEVGIKQSPMFRLEPCSATRCGWKLVVISGKWYGIHSKCKGRMWWISIETYKCKL